MNEHTVRGIRQYFPHWDPDVEPTEDAKITNCNDCKSLVFNTYDDLLGHARWHDEIIDIKMEINT